MTTELLLVQLLVLGATGVLFWLARRDLASRASAAAPPPPETQELEQLCVTLEALVTDLARRLDRLERQTSGPGTYLPSAAPVRPEGAGVLPKREDGESRTQAGHDSPPPPETAGGTGSLAGVGSGTEDAANARYAPVYALLDAGETNSQEIARRTGLSGGEVDLILSLRARRAL